MDHHHPHSHFLLLALAAQGHTNPTLEFAMNLLRAGSLVTFATPSSALKLVNDSPLPMGLTLAAFSEDRDFREDSLTAIFAENAANGSPITHMVHTNLLSWAVPIADRFDVPSTLLWLQSATVLHMYYYYFNGGCDVIRDCEKDPSWSLKLPNLPFEFKTQDLPAYLLPSSPYAAGALPLFHKQIEDLMKEEKPKVIVNTFEADVLTCLSEDIQLIPIGPLFSLNKSYHGDICRRLTSKDDENHIKWLDSHRKSGGVIYVSFGSFWGLSKEQLQEMARALINTKRPFLWVLREDKEECLGSYGEELKKNGIIVPWCSQLKVLSHPSVGCFVTHCGWNSTLESVSCGVPMVAFPQSSDQMTNAKMVEEVWKVGVRVKVGQGNGLVKNQEISRCLELVMEDQSIKGNAMKLSDVAGHATTEGGSSCANLRVFIDHTTITS